MLKFKKINKESEKLQLVKVNDFNFHNSIIDTSTFDKIFTREYFRYEFFKLKSRIDNKIASDTDMNRIAAINEFFKDTFEIPTTNLSDAPNKEMKSLLLLTLYAHDHLISDYDFNESTETYYIKTPYFTLGLHELYKACKSCIINIENGDMSIEDACKLVKPLYNNGTKILNHDAVEKSMKRWNESTKAHMTTRFVTGLFQKYSLTKSNRIKSSAGVLNNQVAFEKYFAMWLVSNGTLVNKKTSDKSQPITFETMLSKM